MQIQVLLEPINEGRFRASSSLFRFDAEGATEEEATRNYCGAVAAQLLNGGKVVAVDVPESATSAISHPWMTFAGTLPNDQMTADWMQSMADYRRELDTEASI